MGSVDPIAVNKFSLNGAADWTRTSTVAHTPLKRARLPFRHGRIFNYSSLSSGSTTLSHSHVSQYLYGSKNVGADSSLKVATDVNE